MKIIVFMFMFKLFAIYFYIGDEPGLACRYVFARDYDQALSILLQRYQQLDLAQSVRIHSYYDLDYLHSNINDYGNL